MSAQDNLIKALSVSGAVSITLGGDGLFQCSIRAKNLVQWHLAFASDPTEALQLAVGALTAAEQPDYDIFKAAADRRAGKHQRKRPSDSAARAAVEHQFSDLLG